MDNLIRKKLQDLIAHRGQGLCSEPDQCKAAVKQLCDRHPAEQFVLASIVDLGMLAPILELSDQGGWRDLAAQLVGRLQKERSLNHDSARWGVETWAVALGKLDEAELRTSESAALGRSPEGITLDRRLFAAFLAGAIHGALLWLVGWAVSWGLADPLQGALIGAGL